MPAGITYPDTSTYPSPSIGEVLAILVEIGALDDDQGTHDE